jgi:nitrile hydratase subunit beta
MSYASHADLGGQTGHGAVTPEPEGELFHAAWESRVLALTIAMGATGSWNLDQGRAARETLPDYAMRDYYQKWFGGLSVLMLQRGLVRAEELASGRSLDPPRPLPRVLKADRVAKTLARRVPYERPPCTPARFGAGQAVRTRRGDVPHHSRLPRYAQDKLGRIERVHGAHVFADTNSQGLGEQPQWLYTVVFEGTELWGPEAAPGLAVSVEAWEPYLAAA